MSKKEIKFMQKKSIDSFLLALEVFNKPTINYRLEGCVFFLCNAWELLLKAKLLSDKQSIYYPEKSTKKPKRTLSISDCASKVMTNEKDPIRINLSVITSLRNTATHYIVPEYEAQYIPFLAYNVRAYSQKIYEYFGINTSDYIKTDFISLFTSSKHYQPTNILGKYGHNISKMYETKKDIIANTYSENPKAEIALNVQVNLVRVSKESLADVKYYVSNDPNDPHATNINKSTDKSSLYLLTHNKLVEQIDEIIKRESIPFNPIRIPIATKKNPNPKLFTTHSLDLILKEYDIKKNEQYCISIPYGTSTLRKYSNATVTFIISMITGNPNLVRAC